MAKIKNTSIKTFKKILIRTFLVLLLLLLLTAIALTLPVVQTKLAHYATEKINKKYGTDINVEQVAVTVFGGVKLKKIMIKDANKDTLIYANRVNTSILDFKKLIDGDLIFGAMRADGLTLNIKTKKGEKDSNLDKFIDTFDDGKPSSGKFLMTSKKITLTNSRFIVIDYNREVPKDVDFTNLNAVITNFKIKGPNVTTSIQEMSFKDHRGLVVENLKSEFTYTKENIRLEKLDLKTQHSNFNGDVILKYNRKDFSDFNNKVIFDINTNKAKISSTDIKYFWKEMGKNQEFNFSGKLDGTLNDFYAKNLKLTDNHSIIEGDVNFKYLFPTKNEGEFYMKGSFDKVSSSYEKLTALLPNVLGKKLPTSLKKLGQFNLVGGAEITTKTIDTDFDLQTKLGRVKSNLVMTNIDNIDNAKYTGTVTLENFDLGSFTNRKDLGKVTMTVDVDGKGFKEKYLNTSFSGEVQSIKYNGYTYKNIIADGKFKKPIFEGKVSINDPNLFLDFDGKVDLSKRENSYDFHTKVDYANLKNLNFINQSIAVFKGDVVMKVSGSNLDNLKGDVIVNNASYQNKKDIYFFDDLTLSSHFNNLNERSISIFSPNAVKGNVEGKFKFNQIEKMVKNSLGSLYTNYKPTQLSKGQYLKFSFEEFNKLVEIFNTDVTFAQDAKINGSINGDDNDFKFNFTSTYLNVFENHIDNLQLNIDNKNPLYNTYIEIDTIKTKHYKIRDFSLINVTANDTLQFRTEFKGGEKGNDFYNLNAYHTINKENKNVVGFNKSEMMFKDYLWNINEKENDKNKITFDRDLKNFNFEDIIISHENQSLQLNGLINGTDEKDIQLKFNEVNLSKITPDLDNFKFEGFVNGDVYVKQKNAIYQPTAQLEIRELLVNENELGNLKLDIIGDNTFQKFVINSEIENENFKSLSAQGDLQIVNKETVLDLDLNFQKFNLGILSNIGGDVLNNIRGNVSGDARIFGNINDINYTGKLFVNDAGFTIPYLGVDYKVEQNSVVDVTKTSFNIEPTTIEDTKYATTGNLKGNIKHKEFGQWQLDLDINSNRILALNTKDHEDAVYFGTAFIKGNATIKGPTNALVIDVAAKSEQGTDIKIPINNADAVSENNYIHFLTPNEKYKIKDEKATQTSRNYNGLQMNFEFDILPNASIEVILDRESGHGMKGSGEGTLSMNINTLGNFNMTGDFMVYKGTYNFKYGGLINKKFEVKKYGYINWDGDPFNATLNLEAVYNTNANPGVLLENTSINQKTPVEVIIGLKGTIANPEPDFDIQFPNVSSTMRAEIETKLADKDTRSKQAIFLLSTGGFLSTQGEAQYANFAFETASSILGNILNDDSGKMQLGVNYYQADKTAVNPTDGRVVATFSTKVNDRITINGKVGVPVGGVNESTIVGNFELQYRVNEDGTLNLRVFNRENDINYIGQGVGYTQGLGVSYEVDFDTFKELVNKIFTKKKIDVVKQPEPEKERNLPDYINFKEKEGKPKTEKTQTNKEAIKDED